MVEPSLVVLWFVGSIPHGGSSQCSTAGIKKGCAMSYHVCVMEHIKEPLLLIKKNGPCSGDNGLSLLLSE